MNRIYVPTDNRTLVYDVVNMRWINSTIGGFPIATITLSKATSTTTIIGSTPNNQSWDFNIIMGNWSETTIIGSQIVNYSESLTFRISTSTPITLCYPNTR